MIHGSWTDMSADKYTSLEGVGVITMSTRQVGCAKDQSIYYQLKTQALRV
jgi:hypothetical protein